MIKEGKIKESEESFQNTFVLYGNPNHEGLDIVQGGKREAHSFLTEKKTSRSIWEQVRHDFGPLPIPVFFCSFD